MTTALSLGLAPVQKSPLFRVTTYEIRAGVYVGQNYNLTLENALSPNYFVMIYPSVNSTGNVAPSEWAVRVNADPFGTSGALSATGNTRQISLRRGAVAPSTNWVGSVVVVECLDATNVDGFQLQGVMVSALSALAGTGTQSNVVNTPGIDIGTRFTPFGGFPGGGAECNNTNNDRNPSVEARIFANTSITLGITRKAGVANTCDSATFTTYLVKWGSNWTIQSANITGTNGGALIDASGEFNTAVITSVVRARTWIVGFGCTGRPEPSRSGTALLFALGNGVAQNTTETSVAAGLWTAGDAKDCQVFVMTNPKLRVDWGWEDNETAIAPKTFVMDNAVEVEGYRAALSNPRVTVGQRAPWLSNGTSTATTGNWPEAKGWPRLTDRGLLDVNRFDDAVGTAWTMWVASVDFGNLEIASNTTAAPGPMQYIILPDLELDGEILSTITTEDGYRVGPVTPATTNEGRLYPFHTGDPTADLSTTYRIQVQGNLEEAFWIFKETGGSYLGWNANDFIWGVHSVDDLNSSVYGMAACYSRVWDRTVVAYRASSGTTTLTFVSQDLDAAPYSWQSLGSQVTADARTGDEAWSRLLELPDGALRLIVSTFDSGDGGDYDFDLYGSQDGGESWSLIATRLVYNASGRTAGLSVAPKCLQFACSGDWVRLVYTNSTDGLETLVSSDRGGSWNYLGVNDPAITVGDSLESFDSTPVALVGLNDGVGTFLLWVLDSGSSEDVIGYTTTRDEEWTAETALDLSYETGSDVTKLAAVLGTDGIFLLAFNNRTASTNTMQLEMNYFSADDPTNTDLQSSAGAIGNYGSLSKRYQRLQFMDTGRELQLVCGLMNGAGSAWASGLLFQRMGGWSTRPVQGLLKSGSVPTEHWHFCGGQPQSGTVSPRMPLFNLTTAVSLALTSGLHLTDTNVGNYAYWEMMEAGSNYKNDGLAMGAIVKCAANSNNTAGANVGMKAIVNTSGGPTGASFFVSVTTTMIAMHDLVSSSEKAYISTPDIATSYYEIRASLWDNSSAMIAARKFQASDWEERSSGWSTSGVVALGMSGALTMDALQWGHFPNNGGGDNDSTWREWWGTPGSSAQDLLQKNYATADIRGRPCTIRPARLREGVDVFWGGGGAAIGDTFTGEVEKSYGRQNLFVDSPSFYWQAAGVTQQEIVIDYGSGERSLHEAIALIGTRCRTALFEYNNINDWTNPLMTFTADATILTSARVVRTDGRAIMLDDGSASRALPPAMQGIGKLYMRVTSASTTAANGKTFRVKKQANTGWFSLESEANTSADYGAGYSIAAGDSVCIFGDRMATRYGREVRYQYMRIILPAEELAEGKHALGNVVAGPVADFDPPLDWTWKDNQQPNTTEYRSKSGIRWGQKEGPAQRVLQARMVGDYTQRGRETIRSLLNLFASYDVRPVALVQDHLNVPEQLFYGYISTGGQNENEGWFQDASGNWRGAGDTAIQVVEVT